MLIRNGLDVGGLDRWSHGGGAAYDPSTFFTGGTKGPWYDFGNTVTTLNAGGTAATAGQTVATENDAGTAAINASQATDANRPTLAAAHQNSRNAILADSTDLFDVTGLNAFTNGASSIQLLTVFQPTDGTTNHSMWRSFDASFSYDRINALFVGLKPSIKYSKDGGDFANLRTGASDLTAATYHAIIYHFDFTNGQTGIFVDNAAYLAVAAAGGTTVAGAMNATDGNQSRIVLTSKGYYLDMYIHKNALMDATQRSNWFAAVKSRFALTAY